MNLSTMTLPAGVDRAKLSRTRGESALRLGVRLCLVPRPHPKNRSDWQSFNGTLSRDCQSFDQWFGGVPASEEPLGPAATGSAARLHAPGDVG